MFLLKFLLYKVIYVISTHDLLAFAGIFIRSPFLISSLPFPSLTCLKTELISTYIPPQTIQKPIYWHCRPKLDAKLYIDQQDDDHVDGEEGGAPVQPLQPRPAIPDPQDNDGGLGAVHQVI